MKKLIAFLLTISLFLSLCSLAMAAGPSISTQPESATTDEKGTVSFQIKASGYKGLTWRFLNPATGEEITGKKLNTVFKKIKVSNPNGHMITLRNVPEEMHGWIVYCHLTGNGFEVDSDKVRLLVYGLPDPDAETSSVPESEGEPIAEIPPAVTDTTTEITEITVISEAQTSNGDEPQQETPQEMHIDENGNLVPGAAEVVRTITIRAKDATLYPIDAYGTLNESSPAVVMTFEGSADVAVRAEGPVRYWLLNDMQLEPMESNSGFVLRNIRNDLVITAVPVNKVVREVDETMLVSVTCEGCRFTWSKGGIKNATSGDVPAGSEILIICNPAPKSGYSLNGGPYEDAGKVSVRRTVTEDTVITVK